jgi:hypothetical protein
MKFHFKDWIISRIPYPFFIPAIRLFNPKLWNILKAANVTRQNDKTLMTWKGKGHILINSSEIQEIGP